MFNNIYKRTIGIKLTTHQVLLVAQQFQLRLLVLLALKKIKTCTSLKFIESHPIQNPQNRKRQHASKNQWIVEWTLKPHFFTFIFERSEVLLDMVHLLRGRESGNHRSIDRRAQKPWALRGANGGVPDTNVGGSWCGCREYGGVKC